MSGSGLLLRLSGTLRQALRSADQRHLYGNSGDKGEVKAEYLYLRARALLRAGERQNAIRLLQQACELDPAFADAVEALGEAMDSVGDTTAAAAQYELARKLRRDIRCGAPDRHFVWRQPSSSTGEILAYGSVIRSLYKHALPLLARGNAYMAGGQPELALADYQHALKFRPDSLDPVALKGEALVGLGRYREAAELFDSVLSARPKDIFALNARGISRMALGHIEDANADWRQQLKLLAGQPTASAYVALRLADYETGLPYLQSILRADGSTPYWTLYTSTALLRTGQSLPVMRRDGDDSWPMLLIALQEGRATADEVLARADTPPRRGEAQFQLGVLTCGWDRAAARQHWQQVVELSPPTFIEYAAARNELARLGS